MSTNKLITLALLGAAFGPSAFAQTPPTKITFNDHVLPIFKNACLNCHNPDRKRGGLDIASYGATIAGSDGQKIVAVGDPESSVLYKLVAHTEEPKMPQRADKLPAKDIETIKQWIAQGALENSGSVAVAVKPKLAVTVEPSATGKPTGEPAMPKGLSLDPVVKAKRPGAIIALAASPWAPVAAVGSQKQVLLYNTQSFDLLGILPFPEGFPEVVKFSRNGSLLVVGGGVGAKSGKVVLFDVSSGKRIGEVGDEYDQVLAADISPDQSRVALGGPSRMLKVHATADGALQHSLKKHTDWVTAVAFSPDGKFLASADRAGGLVVWDGESAHELFVLNGHKSGVTDLAFRGDSRVLVSSSEDGTIKLWDMEEGKPLKSVNAHPGGAMSVNFTHDGRIVSAGRDKLVKTWTGDGNNPKATEALPDVALRTVFDHEGKRVLAGDFAGTLRVFDATDAKKVADLDANPPTAAERMAKLEQKLKDHEAASAKAAKELDLARQALAKAETEAKSAEQSLTTKQSALAAAQETVKRLTAEMEQDRKKADSVKAAVGPVKEAVTKLEKAKSETDQQLKLARDAVEKTRSPKLQAAAQ